MPNPPKARRSAALLAVVAAGVSALAATTLTMPAQAAAPTAAAAAPAAKVTKKQDRVWRANLALARAQKALSPNTPADERPDATLALRKLALLKDALSPADRAVADKLSSRPSKPQTAGDANILIHYNAAELNPSAYTIEQALASLAYVGDTYASSGYKRPKSDRGRGGDNRIDIYLDQLPPGLYGYCTTDQRIRGPKFDVWAYCVLDNDYAGFPTNTPLQNFQVTAAHEYYHATQYAYDAREDNWFLEATATWAEDELFDNVNDNRQYLRDSPITKPGKSMDKFGGVFHYGVWNFFRYLTELYPARTGAMPTLILDMWKAADSSKGPRKNKYSTNAINKTLKKKAKISLAEVFAQYSAATRFPQLSFSEGAALSYPVKPLGGTATLAPQSKKSFNTRLNHLTSSTYQFVPSGTPAGSKLKVRFKLGAKQTGARAVAVIYTTTGLAFEKIKLNRRGAGSKKFDFTAGTVGAVEITLVNASTRYQRCFKRANSPFACSGVPRDQKVPFRIKAKVA